MIKPLCFVFMPLGEKDGPGGKRINFDAVYEELIRPALEKTELEPVRSENILSKSNFEQLLLCDFAIADITMANGDVFYQLGVRHAVRPYKTLMISAGVTHLPFESHIASVLSYHLNTNGSPGNKQHYCDTLTEALLHLKTNHYTDSSLFLLFDELRVQTLDHNKTDIFRDVVIYSGEIKEQLKKARQTGLAAVKQLETQLGEIKNLESAIIVDLFLSYRATGGYQEMITMAEKIPEPLAQRLMMQEQLAFALNRNGQPYQAETILKKIISQRGPSSETQALLGRIYKDLYENALKKNDPTAAIYLDKAIDVYLKGFQADCRDAFPGINAVTLLDIQDPIDPRKKEILPIVTYAVKQKIAKGTPDYWDYATLLELAVLADNPEDANHYLKKCRTSIRESWEPQTTVRNLRLIREAREKRGLNTQWITQIEAGLID